MQLWEPPPWYWLEQLRWVRLWYSSVDDLRGYDEIVCEPTSRLCCVSVSLCCSSREKNENVHTPLNTSTHQHINTSTRQHVNTSTRHQYVNTSTQSRYCDLAHADVLRGSTFGYDALVLASHITSGCRAGVGTATENVRRPVAPRAQGGVAAGLRSMTATFARVP